jgi:hypothetical protein
MKKQELRLWPQFFSDSEKKTTGEDEIDGQKKNKSNHYTGNHHHHRIGAAGDFLLLGISLFASR